MSDAEKHGYGRYGTLEIHGMTLVCWSVFKPFVPVLSLLSLLSFARPSHIRLYTTRADKSSHASSCFSNLAVQASKESKVLVFIQQKIQQPMAGPETIRKVPKAPDEKLRNCRQSPFISRSGHAAVISRTAGDQCLWSPLRRALRCNRCPSGCPEPVGCP